MFINNFALSLLLIILLIFSTNTNGKLLWNRFEDSNALCNDYTHAGYFISSTVNQSSTVAKNRWVIFLESGGVCSTPDDCNYRYKSFRA